MRVTVLSGARAAMVMVAALLLTSLVLGNPARSAPAPTMTLTLESNQATVTHGEDVTLSGTLANKGGSGLPNKRVVLEHKPVGSPVEDFEPVPSQPLGGIPTANDGSFSLSGVVPAGSTDYRARYVQGNKVSTSPTERVNVRVRVSIELSRRSLTAHQKVVIFGSIYPAQAGGSVTLEIRNRGQKLARVVPVVNSRYRYAFTAPKAGRHSVVARYSPPEGQSSYLGNRSVGKVFVVR